MLSLIVAALLQVTAGSSSPVAPAAAIPADTGVMNDSTRGQRRRARREQRPPRRIEVTAEHLATAFRDPAARAVLLVARAARMQQDSALQGYDATTYQRISVGLGFTKIGRERLAFRSEATTRVRWRRGIGAYVDVTGSRSVVPIAGKSGNVDIVGNISPIPYYPGRESLWIGSSVAREAVDENKGMVHPLAAGAEAYYTYESGDSVTFRLPGGQSLLLRELRVRPRVPRWNLAVGSLWFDMSGGQLVRAAYRMSVPMDIGAVALEDDSTSFDDVPRLMKPLMFPMTAQLSAIGVEYGLYAGRFWLPRLQVAEGSASASFVRIPLKLEQRFAYENVNAGAALPPIVVAPADTGRKLSGGVTIGMGSPSVTDSLHAARRAARRKCDESGNRTFTRDENDSHLLVKVTMSCDSSRLANSPDLPPSIYATGEDVVDGTEMNALVAQALSMRAQAGFAPQPVRIMLDNPRYNRVEGLSLGARADQELGAGYAVHALASLGVADRQPDVQLTASRSDLRRTLAVTAYNRLVAANDYGNPLSLGRSINAFVFGRDDGFYYRASGVEFGSSADQPSGSMWSWGLFAEQQRTADRRTTYSLARIVSGSSFDSNIVATREAVVGARTRFTGSRGLDVQGLRLFTDARLETATGRTSGSYGRATLDVTASHGIGNGAAALTLAAGTTAGTVPSQRLYYLGGSQTIRGQEPGASRRVGEGIGNAFWMARGEVARGLGVVRPVVFGDIGWAGDRSRLREIGRPLSGAGVGLTMLDGLVRFDLARGIFPKRQWRVESYVEARF